MTPEERILAVAVGPGTAAIVELGDLVDHCLETTDLAALAAAQGEHPADFLFYLLEDSDLVRVTDDDRVHRIDRLLDSVVFTHRLTAREIANDLVDLTPDLAYIDADGEHLHAPGGTTQLEFDSGDDPHLAEHGSLVGPPGWLQQFEPGELVAFRRNGRLLTAETAGDVGEGAGEATALADAFLARTMDDPGIGEEPMFLLEEVLLGDPALFRSPVPPVADLFARGGLEVIGGWVGRAGVDWKPPMVARIDRLRDRLSTEYRLDDCCDEALDTVVAAWHGMLGGGAVDVAATNRALGHGRVVEAFSSWIDEIFGLTTSWVGTLTGKLTAGDRKDTAPALMLKARHLESSNDPLAAKAALEEAIRVEPDFGPALSELAWYASDSGDPRRTVSLLRRAGFAEDAPHLRFHATLTANAFRGVGRNERCPCGSGRKYKLCHIGRTDISTQQRLEWLLAKLATFVARPDRIDTLLSLAMCAASADSEIEDLVKMADDTFILELRVFDDGGLTEFLDARGPLLPDDERDILELWEMASLSLWEVIATDGAQRLTLRDTRTDDALTVADRSMARDLPVGQQILARFLPAWGQTWASGTSILIDPQHRDSLIGILDMSPDSDTIAQWYGSLTAPPTLANRESEPLLWCEARLEPREGWGRLTTHLDATFERDPEQEGEWLELFAISPDERVVRASLKRQGDELLVTANSEARLDRVTSGLATSPKSWSGTADLWTRLPPGLQQRNSHHPRSRYLRKSSTSSDRCSRGGGSTRTCPHWGGLTPREAAADPTRREDLIALLRSFERRASIGDAAMRPDVLRRALGIDD